LLSRLYAASASLASALATAEVLLVAAAATARLSASSSTSNSNARVSVAAWLNYLVPNASDFELFSEKCNCGISDSYKELAFSVRKMFKICRHFFQLEIRYVLFDWSKKPKMLYIFNFFPPSDLLFMNCLCLAGLGL